MSETPTDRVELTARCGYTVTNIDGNEEPCDLPATGHRWYQDVGEHEDLLDLACDNHRNEGGRLIASLRADLQALTAERDELRLYRDEAIRLMESANADVKELRWELDVAWRSHAAWKHDAEALRAELAAANAKISKWAEDYKKLAHDCGGTEMDRQALAARCAELEGEISEGFPERDLLYEQIAALQATLDRVTALADEWNRDKPPRTASVFGRALRSAISGDGA